MHLHPAPSAAAVLTLCAALLASPASAQPVINSINHDTLPRSGRIALTGTGFGAGGGNSRVEIGGLPALAAAWTAGRIVAYVPEGAPVGSSTVKVIAGGQASNEVPLEVTLRQRDGRVRWTFEAAADDMWFRPARAPDGTLYIHTSGGVVYAISPDGALKWIASALWFPYIPPTAGPDGTVYCGSIQTITAISPEGQIDWTYIDQSAQGLQNAITVGPDGHLHGAYTFGPGAISLTTAGAYRWSNTGNPAMYEYGGTGNRTIFGPSEAGGPVDQVYIGMDLRGNNRLYAFDIDSGDERWAVPVGPNGYGAEPTIGSDGTVYTPDFIAAGVGWNIQALDPSDGHTKWYFDGDFISGCTDLAIGPDDTLYYARDLGHLEALDTGSRSRRWHNFTGNVLGRPEITPDAELLVLGGVVTYGDLGFIRAYSTGDGQEMWSVTLPGEIYPGSRFVPVDSPLITPDGATAYVSTVMLGGSADPHSLLYAVDTSTALDCDDDGVLDADDNCECTYNPDQEDRDGDGIGDACDDFVQADDCADATQICPGFHEGNTFGASPDGESTCSPFPDSNKDVWYAYTPATSGQVTVSGCGSPYLFYLSAHTGCPGTPQNEVACDEDSCDGFMPELSFLAQAGQTYFIRVNGYGIAQIDYSFTLSGPDCGAPCPADFNADGAVNTLDVLSFLNAWSAGDPAADFNGDGAVNTLDVLAFLNAWSAGC
jgi:hypothetical protein